LRDPQRFYAWLDGICRNVCHRYREPDGTLRLHESLSTLTYDHETQDEAFLALPDSVEYNSAIGVRCGTNHELMRAHAPV
jgi:hypothetical protein